MRITDPAVKCEYYSVIDSRCSETAAYVYTYYQTDDAKPLCEKHWEELINRKWSLLLSLLRELVELVYETPEVDSPEWRQRLAALSDEMAYLKKAFFIRSYSQ